MTDIVNIPLNKLTAWEGNVRKTQNKSGIDELAASIKAHGLQQNLGVVEDGKKFAVVAGRRRLKALQRLAKAGDIEATYGVPCRITEAADAAEISLAENVVREEMHPVDQFEASVTWPTRACPSPDIAARFGKSERHVLKVLKLARDQRENPRSSHASQLAAVLHLDMTAGFTPTAENYFNRVSKLQILEALQEARQQPPAPAWANLKKAELAALAARETAATGWLPLPLRRAP